MTSTHHLYLITIAGSAIMLLTAITLKPVSDAAPTSEHAAAIPSHGPAAGEAAVSSVSPLNSDSEG